MSTSIESLSLEIESNSKGAIDGIKALAESLGRLKNATSGLGLKSVAKGLGDVKDAVDNMGNITNKLNGLARAVKELTNLGNIKVSASIGNQITKIGTALSTFNMGDGANKIQELVTALKPLETLGKSTLGTTVNALNKLPEAIQKIDMRKLHGQVDGLTRIMKPLADEMQKVANGFNALPSRIQKLITENNKLSSSNKKTSDSYINLAAKMKTAYTIIKSGAKFIGSAIDKSADYTENVNLFTVAMGDYAGEARDYAENVGEVMGIDPGEWMRNQGTFMTLATGFGVTSDRANTMSKNLTQLGYDISSFFNLPYEDAMQKLQSGLAGELEPLRRIGYDLSVARLQQEAYTLGINKKVSAMTQAEKAELRYYAIMTQVTTAHGDMARTLDQPANQIRVLKAQFEQAGRAIGNMFIPALKVVLPYLIAIAKVVRMVANELAKLFGYKEDVSDMGDIGSLASGADDYSSALGDAADNAKKLKQFTAGFDELNVIDPNKGNSGNTSATGGTGGSLGFELPEFNNFLGKDSENKVTQIVEYLKENLPTVVTLLGGIGAAIAGWAISNVIVLAKALRDMAGIKFNGLTAITGLTLFLQDLTTLKKYIEDFQKNGASFYNVSGIISTFAGMIGDALIVLGNVKTGAALKVVEGIGQIVGAIHDMSKNGVDWDNVMSTINGLSNVAIGIGLFTGNLKVAGWGMAIQGFTTVIDELKHIWEAIKTGDWSGVDYAALAIGVIEGLGGIAMALGVFSKIKKTVDTGSVGKEIADVGDTVTNVGTQTSALSGKLKSLVKDLGLGILIIGEVALAAGIFVGAIWGIGKLLDETGKAWQPVIDNAGTVAIAIGIGTALLVAIGVAAFILGTATTGSGGTIAAAIGIGMAMMLELGAATGLFLAEIWGIGVLLEQIGLAWQPVLDNGETIATAIEKGTELLVGIGIVTAALGAVTVASAGTLPIAIGIGTGLLLKLGKAFKEFCDNLVSVANKLREDLHPSLEKLNKVLPKLNDNMEDFTEFMVDFAEMTVEYTKSTAISGFASTIDSIIGFFTKDPIQALADDVGKQYKQSKKLNENLALANPELQTAITGLRTYKTRIDTLKGIVDTIDVSDLAITDFENLVTIGGEIVKFGKKMKSYYEKIKDITVTKMDNMVSCMNDIIDFAVRIKNEVEINKINEFTEAIKKLTTAVKNLPTSKTLTIKAIYQTSGSAPKQFASGGFPETGEMFIAREAGPELVGSIGRKTAVANNDQIVAGIASGVASANTESNALLREQNSLLKALLEKESGVYLDGKRLTNSVEKYQSQRGRQIVVGGAY